MQTVNLEKLEHDSFLAYYQDGILDLMVGLSLIGASWCIFARHAEMGFIAPLIALVLYLGLKRFLTRPRLGYVKFAPPREKRIEQNKIQLTVFGAVTFVLGLAVSLAYSGDSPWQLWIRSLGAIPIGLVFAACAAALGQLYGANRGLVYAAIILITFVAGHLLDLGLPYQLMFPGLIMTVTGLYLLIHFVKRYPRLPEDKSNDT